MPLAKLHNLKSLPFTGQAGFRKTLNQRVNDFIAANKLRTRDLPEMYVKTGVVFAAWIATYALWIASGALGWHWAVTLLLSCGFGVTVAGIGFNVMHDANHNGYSNRPWLNRLLGYSVELCGISTFIWRQQHNVWHHTYTNIAGMDEGLETDGFLRSSPRDVWRPIYRIQHLYAPLVYAFAGMGLLLFRNFTVYFTGKSSRHFVYPRMTRGDHVAFWIGRALNALVYFAIPLLTMPWWLALLGFVLATFTAGLVMSHVLMLAHIHDELEFAEPVGDPLHVENEWAIHQVITTMNFSPRNQLVNWFTGGLNWQIEHHLFPQMCHLLYPKIAPIVEATCREFGVVYRSDPGFLHAIGEHYKSLRAFGRRPALA